MLIKRHRIPYLQIILIGLLPSYIKILFYRLSGYKIGKNVRISLGSVLIGRDVIVMDNVKIGFVSVLRGTNIRIERFVQIGSMVFIDCDKIRIGEDSRINEQVIIGGLKTLTSSIDIGERTIIMEYSFINPTLPIKIGDDTGIGGHCLIFTHGTWLNALDGFPYKYAPVTIGKNVWLAWRVFILPGVEIGDNVVIGANSLVRKSIPSNSLAAGELAKVIKSNYPIPLDEVKRKELIEQILNEFIEYLMQNGFDVEAKLNDSVRVLRTLKKKKQSILVFSNLDTSVTQNVIENDSVLIVDGESHISNHSFKMILNLKTKTRIGTSKIGEEMAKYFSRYGIRFKRMD